MKNLRVSMLVILVAVLIQSCIIDDNFWDPNKYVVVNLDAVNPIYDFRTGQTYNYNNMPKDIDNFGIINEPWCTDLPALCGNMVLTDETSFSAFTSAPTSGYEQNCLNLEKDKVVVFKLGDGSFALVKVVTDFYYSNTTGCEHKVTLHVNYPAFTGKVSVSDEEKEEEQIVYTNGKGIIGEKGGKITVEDASSDLNGISIEIPPGALSSDVEISINESESDFLLNQVEPDAIWIKMEPAGLNFEKPVKIGIPYNKGNGLNPDEISMRWSNGVDDGGTVPLFEIDYANKIYYGGLDHFTYFGLTTIMGSGSDLKWFVDTRDSSYYLTRKIGNQWWFCNDARYKVGGSKVYNDDESNAKKYGRLYTWSMAKQACPSGWRVPSKQDWEELERNLGMTDDEIRITDGIRTWTEVVQKLAQLDVVYYLQGFYREGLGYDAEGNYTIYWTSTESYSDLVWTWDLYEGAWYFMPTSTSLKTDYVSLKCVK